MFEVLFLSYSKASFTLLIHYIAQNQEVEHEVKHALSITALDDRASECTKEEPDVTIIVGGKEFWHYRQIPSVMSDYLYEGIKESKTIQLELPDRDSDEWAPSRRFWDVTDSSENHEFKRTS